HRTLQRLFIMFQWFLFPCWFSLRRSLELSIYFVVLFGAMTHPAYGQGHVALSELTEKDSISLSGRMAVLIDPGGQLNLEDVVSSANGWQPRKAEEINYGFTTDTYWFRLNLRNDTNKPQKYYVAVRYPLLDDVRLI